MDTHSQPGGLSVTSVVNEVFTFTSTPTPHLTSTALPMILKLKYKSSYIKSSSSSYIKSSSSSRLSVDDLVQADEEAIYQGLDRIWAQLSFSVALSKIIVFVSTGHFTWCMVFLRKQNTYSKTIRESIDIVIITPHQLDSLWQDITAKAVEYGQEYYLTPDGSMLYRSLNSLGLPFIYCRIKYISGCKSKVYAITVPNKNQQVSSTTPTWAVKIVHDDEAFRREAYALEQIHSKWNPTVQKRQFYALGVWHNNTHPNPDNRSRSQQQDVVDWKSKALTSNSIEEEEDSYWWNSVGNATGGDGNGSGGEDGSGGGEDGSGGVIFMRVGIRSLDKIIYTERATPMNQVMKSLHVIHSANIFHCDIRPWNIMEFADGWQVIDFDLSCVPGEEVELTPGSSQYEHRPDDVKMLGDGSSPLNVVWKEEYDTQMMVNSFPLSIYQW
eukprot:gene833-1623_t